MSNIEIDTSSDSVEQVQEALGASVEIEDSTKEEAEKPEPKTKEKPAEKVTEEEAESTETQIQEGEEEEKPEAEKEAAKEEEKAKKPAPNLVPRSRLNEEIQRRKDAERRLSDKEKEKPTKETEVAEVSDEPKTYPGLPEPKIEDYLGNEKYADPYAAFTKEYAQFSRKEAVAEVEFKNAQAAEENQRIATQKIFNERKAETLTRRPDYDDVVNDSPVIISTFMEKRVYKSPIGPDLLIHFCENPEVAKKIVAMDLDDQAVAMVELEKQIKEDIKSGKASKTKPEITEEEEAEEEAEGTLPKKPLPKKEASKAPEPPKRIKPAGPGPKTLEELAGPTDKVGIDIDFNPEYERAVKAGKKI